VPHLLFLQDIVVYYKIGRSILRLMEKTSFHEVAYQAELSSARFCSKNSAIADAYSMGY
jgi:hypothetical protein